MPPRIVLAISRGRRVAGKRRSYKRRHSRKRGGSFSVRRSPGIGIIKVQPPPIYSLRTGAGRRRRRRRTLRGGSIFGSIWNGIKSVHGFVKKHKIISRAAPIIGTLTGNPFLGKAAGVAAGLAGYGPRRRSRTTKGRRRRRVYRRHTVHGSGSVGGSRPAVW